MWCERKLTTAMLSSLCSQGLTLYPQASNLNLNLIFSFLPCRKITQAGYIEIQEHLLWFDEIHLYYVIGIIMNIKEINILVKLFYMWDPIKLRPPALLSHVQEPHRYPGLVCSCSCSTEWRWLKLAEWTLHCQDQLHVSAGKRKEKGCWKGREWMEQVKVVPRRQTSVRV